MDNGEKTEKKRAVSPINGQPVPAGRTKGVPNKHTASVKEAFRIAFEEMGGAPALAAWGRDNPTDFYKLASKLIPTEISGVDGGPIKSEQTLAETDKAIMQRWLDEKAKTK